MHWMFGRDRMFGHRWCKPMLSSICTLFSRVWIEFLGSCYKQRVSRKWSMADDWLLIFASGTHHHEKTRMASENFTLVGPDAKLKFVNTFELAECFPYTNYAPVFRHAFMVSWLRLCLTWQSIKRGITSFRSDITCLFQTNGKQVILKTQSHDLRKFHWKSIEWTKPTYLQSNECIGS